MKPTTGIGHASFHFSHLFVDWFHVSITTSATVEDSAGQQRLQIVRQAAQDPRGHYPLPRWINFIKAVPCHH